MDGGRCKEIFVRFGRRVRVWARAFWRTLLSPVSRACFIGFLLAVALSWVVSSRMAYLNAKEMLRSAAADMRLAIDNCVDELLFYEGHAICKHYRTPQAMVNENLDEILKRYNIDELSVVGSNGVAVADSLSGPGFDMGSQPESAKFNCLLGDVETYSQPFRSAVERPGVRRKYAGVRFPPPAKGYVQLGFDETRVKDGIDFWFADLATGRHIGERGFFVIAKEETGVIDSNSYEPERSGETPRERRTLADIGFDADKAPTDPQKFFFATLFGERCLCLTEVRSHHRVVSALPITEVEGRSSSLVRWTSLILLVIFVLVVLFMTKLTRLVDQLRVYIAEEKERQQKDLVLAHTIQTSSLSTDFPDEPDFAISARMITARDVGGDFYDFCRLPDGRMLVLIADVSGKGVPAALFMMRAKAIIRSAVFRRPEALAEAISEANAALAEANDANMFVTAWIAVFDRATGAVECVNAGHNPPLVRHADGSVEWLRLRSGLVLAAMDGAKYRTERLSLRRGDVLFLYTDGVTEAMDADSGQFGEERLESALKGANTREIDAVCDAIRRFVGATEQSDDITILTLRYK